MGLGIAQHGGRGAFDVGEGQDGSLALEVGHDEGVGILGFEGHDGLDAELLVDMATTIPQQHVAPGDGVDIVAEVVVGTEDELFVLGHGVDDLHGVAGGHTAVGDGLHSRRGVDIADDLIAGMLSLVAGQVGSVAAVGEGASGGGVGLQDCLLRGQELAGLSHEVDTTHHQDGGVGGGSLTGQGQGVTDKVGNLLNLRARIVMGQDEGVALFGEATHLSFQCFCIFHSYNDRRADIRGCRASPWDSRYCNGARGSHGALWPGA